MPMPMPTSIKRSDSAQVFLSILYVVFITLIRVGWRASRSLGMAHGNGVWLSRAAPKSPTRQGPLPSDEAASSTQHDASGNNGHGHSIVCSSLTVCPKSRKGPRPEAECVNIFETIFCKSTNNLGALAQVPQYG